MHRRTAVAHSEPTKALLKENPETAILSAAFGCTHPLSFLLKQNLSPRVIAGTQDSFMPDIASYIQERVNLYTSTTVYRNHSIMNTGE